MSYKLGSIAATTSANAVVLNLDLTAGETVGVISVGGTSTSPTFVFEKKMPGGTLWLPMRVKNEKTGAFSDSTAAPGSSTVASYRCNLDGAASLRVYCSAGTGLAVTVEMFGGTTEQYGPPDATIQTSQTTAATFGGGVTFSGATGVNTISIPDALASALDITESTNSYLLFVTTNAGERIVAGKQVRAADNVKIGFGDADDITFVWDATDLLVAQLTADSIVKWGVSGAGINHVFYGDTATLDMTWDQTNNQLLFNDNAKVAIGTGAGSAGDITMLWNGTKMLVAQLAVNSAIEWGVDDDGIDMKFFGATASAYCLWDQSADQLILGGVASVSGLRVATSGATAITTTRAVTKADSGGIFTAAQSSSYTITVAQPAGAGERYLFQCVSPGSFTISLVATGCTFEGTITIDASTIPATGSTLTFASAAAALGDSIELISTSTTKFYVRAIAQASGGITVA